MAQPNLMRRRLGVALRAARKRAGLTLNDAAAKLATSPPTLSRIELGKTPFPDGRLDAYVTAYDLTTAKVEEVRKLAAMASSGDRATLLMQYSDVIDDPFVGYLELEEVATQAQIYTTQVVPGLLQAEEYAQALVASGVMRHTERRVRSFVELRLERQRVLRRENPLSVECIVEETALRRPVGGPEVLRRQLQVIRTMVAELPHVIFRVIPTSAGAHPGVDGQFAVFRFDVGDPIVTVEWMTRVAYLEEDYDIAPYDAGFARLRTLAWSPERSLTFMSGLMEKL